MESTIVAYLQSVFADDAEHIFSAVGNVTIDIPAAATAIEIIDYYPKLMARRTRVDYRFSAADGLSKPYSMWFRTQKIKNVYVATDTIHKHQPLLHSITRVQPADILALLCQPLSEIPDSKVRTRHLISAGEVICQQALEEVPLIEANQRVEMLMFKSGFYLSTTATTLMQGRKGDLVKVRLMHSGLIVSARITDEGLVRYESHN